MIHNINDLRYKKICFEGSYLNDPFFINYEFDLMSEEDISNYFLYYVFNFFLIRILKVIESGKEIRIDNLEDSIFRKIKGLMPIERINQTSLYRYEKLSRVISGKILEIVNDLSGGIILSLNSKVNRPIKTLGGSSYLSLTIDLAYISKDDLLKIVLFEPFYSKTIFNQKTALAFSFFNELHDVYSISIFTFGSNVNQIITDSQIIAFNETLLLMDDRKRKLLSTISDSISNTLLINTTSYDHCSECCMRLKCRKKINV